MHLNYFVHNRLCSKTKLFPNRPWNAKEQEEVHETPHAILDRSESEIKCLCRYRIRCHRLDRQESFVSQFNLPVRFRIHWIQENDGPKTPP